MFSTHPFCISSNTVGGKKKQREKEIGNMKDQTIYTLRPFSQVRPWQRCPESHQTGGVKLTKSRAPHTNGRLCFDPADFCLMREPPEVVWREAWGWLELWMLHEQRRWHMCRAPQAERRMRERKWKWNILEKIRCTYPCEGCPRPDHPGPATENRIFIMRGETKHQGPVPKVQGIIGVKKASSSLQVCLNKLWPFKFSLRENVCRNCCEPEL